MKNSIQHKIRLSISFRIIAIALVFFSATFNSCKKNDDIPLGTIIVSVNGREVNFSSDAKAEWLEVQGGHGIMISGIRGGNEISFDVVSAGTISKNHYVDNTYGNLVKIRYSAYLLFFWNEFASSTAQVNIQEITSEHVKGTFSGTLIDSNGISMDFSEGAFNVSF